MANPYRGELDIEVERQNGERKTYTLTMTWSEIGKMEAALDTSGIALWTRLLQQSVNDYIKVGKILLEPKQRNATERMVIEIMDGIGLGLDDAKPLEEQGLAGRVLELYGRCRHGAEWPAVKAKANLKSAEDEERVSPNV